VRADLEFRSIPAMALISAERFGDATAVIDGEVRLSFKEVADEMVVVAKSLIAQGVEPGDRIALWAPNSARWMTAALGILSVGAWVVPVNTRFKGAETAFVLRKMQARALFCANGFLGTDSVALLRETDPDLPALREVTIIEGPAVEGTTSWEDFLDRGAAVDEAVVRERIDAIRPEDISDVIFTSGTTGRPKGVMLRHGTCLRVYQAFNESFGFGEGDRILIVLPFFHCFGYKAGWMAALMVGATSVPMAVFDPAASLQAIEEHGITHTGGAPTIFWSILDHPARATTDLSSLRVAVVSAAYVPVELIHRMCDELGLDYAMTGYGLTEAHAVVSLSLPHEPPDLVAEWSGRMVAGVEAKVVDDEGVEVPLGERGELLIQGYNVSDGYYQDPEATESVFQADGWLHTGDIAYMNAEGYIKVCDRKKDMFIVGGFNVAPAEVEGMLVDWEEIAAAAVLGAPDPHYGEVGVAFVVPAAGVTLTPEAVIAYARKTMANYKVPRRVEIVDVLPLNATGKVLKDELRARLDP
jgi:HIP---CoA ligase